MQTRHFLDWTNYVQYCLHLILYKNVWHIHLCFTDPRWRRHSKQEFQECFCEWIYPYFEEISTKMIFYEGLGISH